MRFSNRIYALCDAVAQGESVADIGTDHGYVPMLLVKKGVSPYAIMSDISSGSLAKAVETFSLVGLKTDESQFRIGDGLDGINAGEVDDIIVAGLGGLTIAGILDADVDKTRSFRKLILQPRKHSGNLRYYLYTHGYDIVSEVLVPEGKFICEIITAVPTEVTERVTDIEEEDIRWKYPESFVTVNTDYLAKRLDWKLSSIDQELTNLAKSRKDNSALEERLRADREYLIELMKRNREINEEA